jgi:hypothetical protein
MATAQTQPFGPGRLTWISVNRPRIDPAKLDPHTLKLPALWLRFWRPSRASVIAAAVARPNPLFDRDWYLASNPDISAAQVDPWCHYVEFGAVEGRDPNPLFDNDWYLSRHAEIIPAHANPLLHYWDCGAAQGCDPTAAIS